MIRTALLGLGGIGTHLAREIIEHPEGHLAAVVDVDQATLRRGGEELDVEEDSRYTDDAAMYEETELDAVVVATPPAFHDEQVHEALDRGLHVLCEKPVVIDREAARRLHDRVQDSELTFMAGYQRHLDPAFLAVRERYASGDHDPSHVTGELTQDWTGYFVDGTNWRTDPEVGGRGHLFSVGTHVVESALWMTGLEPVAVSAEMEFHDDDEAIDKRAALTVRFGNGALGSFTDSAVAPVTREHVHVWDDEGAAYLDGSGWGQRTLTLVDRDGSERSPDLDERGRRPKFDAFASAIETGSPPPATTGDVLVVTALLDAAYESARTGRRVPIEFDGWRP